MSATPIKAEGLPAYLAESRGLERDLLGEVLASRRRAWQVALGAVAVGITGLVAGIAGLYQPTPVPVLLRMDNASGAVEVMTTLKDHEVSYGEVVDTYWLNQYVLNREAYDWNTIQQQYDTTALLSAPDVQQQYYALFHGPEARDVVLADRARIEVTVRSIQPNGKGQATVRFVTQEVDRNGQRKPAQPQIATVGYAYVNAPMKAADRRVNPLGFQVTAYRADPELGGQ